MFWLRRNKVLRAHAIERLKGPVHGTLQTIRGMCSDQLSHEEIDVKLAEAVELVDGVATMLAEGPRA
jgi:hypothetical protein